jgi:hypothetical protein
MHSYFLLNSLEATGSYFSHFQSSKGSTGLRVVAVAQNIFPSLQKSLKDFYIFYVNHLVEVLINHLHTYLLNHSIEQSPS